ncbi:DMT family transporter [Crocosphaera sp. XPORK-15E]|uniref:DMT family transporter n=1 Tax=Crocosphaera sp. XPORK-15E TaxID=3110247 RepID=UPI002B21344D|nr:DMT family transporter [Crocosphaera sp. XPORK-15E]MEA5533487.1 DMT family transporter [Crocosphaera sp. XPORK-15E]
MTTNNQFIGEFAALGAAFLWAASSIVYAFLGQKIPPLQLNLLKGIVATFLIILTLLLTHNSLPTLTPLPVIILLISGAIGIGLGDTAYFTTLNYLGARRTLLMETLATPMSAMFAFIFLSETLSLQSCLGIILTLLGVAWVITERTTESVINHSHPIRGILWGILAAFSQATGVVLARFALVNSNLSSLESTLLRLIGGMIIIGILLLIPRNQKANQPLKLSLRLIGIISLAAFGSTYLGIWLQQTSLKFAPAGIAQTLLATSPLFVLPFALAMGQKISLRAFLGVLVALAGIGLLFTQ